MQDPRLKPVEIPPPAKPICMLGALLAGPIAWLISPIAKTFCWPVPSDDYVPPGYHDLHGKTLLIPHCFDCGPSPGEITQSIFAMSGALLGLIFLWFAAERNEPWKPARKPIFLINALLIVLHIFFI